MTQHALFRPYSLLRHFCFRLSSAVMPDFFDFFKIFSHASFASDICIAWVIWINLRPNFCDLMNSYFLPQYDLHDTCEELYIFEFSDIRQLQQYKRILFHAPWARQVLLLPRHTEVVQGIAANIWIFHNLRAFFVISINSSSSSGSMKYTSCNFSRHYGALNSRWSTFVAIYVLMLQIYVPTSLVTICRALRSFVFLSVPVQIMYTHPAVFQPIWCIL